VSELAQPEPLEDNEDLLGPSSNDRGIKAK